MRTRELLTRFDERSAHHEVVEGPVLKAAC